MNRFQLQMRSNNNYFWLDWNWLFWIKIDFSLESVAIPLMLRLFKNQNRYKNIKTKTRTQKHKNTKTAKTISLPTSFTTWLMNFWNENESIRKWQMWQILILLHPVIEFQLIFYFKTYNTTLLCQSISQYVFILAYL